MNPLKGFNLIDLMRAFMGFTILVKRIFFNEKLFKNVFCNF
jgi:hypothetical protein